MAADKKKAQNGRKTIIFIDESGLSERPNRVRTWSKKGQTPVLQYSFNWKTLTVTAGISWFNFYFKTYAGSVKSAETIDFLTHLLRHVRGRLIVIWDNLPAHKSKPVRAFIEKNRRRLEVEYLPPYAPELNPSEYIWGYLKKNPLANFCPRDFKHLSHRARNELSKMRRRPKLISAFWKQAELF